MTLWDAYLVLLARIGLSKRAADSPQADVELAGLIGDDATTPEAGAPLLRLAWLGVPLALMLGIVGQLAMLSGREQPAQGIVLVIIAVVLFIVSLYRLEPVWRLPSISMPAATIETLGISARWKMVGAALALSLLTYFSVGDNHFSVIGRVAWVTSLLAWVVAFWEGPVEARLDWRGWINFLMRPEHYLKVSRTVALLAAILVVSALLRYWQLDEVPIAMTSDHVEKIIDVNDILNRGKRPIFEPANGGREPMEFYLAALVAAYGGTGLSYLTLKLVTATAGFITLPIIFLLARELSEDEALALIATLLTGISWWHNVISRNGLRFPLAPLFAALALWLLVRALKRHRRNDALLAGLAMGVGLYGYTPIRVMPLVAIVIVGLYALHHRQRYTWIKLLAWLSMIGLIVAAAFVPLARYAVDEPENFWRRTFTRVTGDPEQPATPDWQVFLANEWNSIRMFNYTGDSAWLVSPAGQPALDPLTGGMFILGVAYTAYRYARSRRWVNLMLLIGIPVMLLPSTLALAFPVENPSLHRSSVAIPFVFIITAMPLRLLFDSFMGGLGKKRGTIAGLSALALFMLLAVQHNHHILFVKYADQYKTSVQNSPELGNEVRAWADSIGDWDTVYVRAFPYWVDTRAVGIYAGKFGWDNVLLDAEQLDDAVNDPRPKLFIVFHRDIDSVTALRAIYPDGKLTYHQSQFLDKDYFTYYVPGTLDFDEHSLAP